MKNWGFFPHTQLFHVWELEKSRGGRRKLSWINAITICHQDFSWNTHLFFSPADESHPEISPFLSLSGNFSKRAAADLEEQQQNCWHPGALWASPRLILLSEGSAGITRHQHQGPGQEMQRLPLITSSLLLLGALWEGRASHISFPSTHQPQNKGRDGKSITVWIWALLLPSTFWEVFRCSLCVRAFPGKAGNPLLSAPNLLQSVPLKKLCCFFGRWEPWIPFSVSWAEKLWLPHSSKCPRPGWSKLYQWKHCPWQGVEWDGLEGPSQPKCLTNFCFPWAIL